MKYIHLFADADGTTHFKDVEVTMKPADYAPPAPPLDLSSGQPAAGLVFIGVPPGWFGDFHPAPKRQWMIIVEGILEIGVSDGEKRTFEPGAVGFLEDAGSKGHTMKAISDVEAHLMVVAVD
jgi:hypothetical protein